MPLWYPMNDLCISFIYDDVRIPDNKFPVNVDMRAPFSPAQVAGITHTRLKHTFHQGVR